MSELRMRRAERADIPALTALWQECFGDTPAFIARFFALLDELGGGVVAECDGKPAGAAYALCAQSLLDGAAEKRVGYIYAVGVHERFRSCGVGRAVTRAAGELARALGAELICTLPAEESLYAWYNDVLGVEKRLYRKMRSVPCVGAPKHAVSPVDAPQYLLRRESLLSGKPHLRAQLAAVKLEEALMREYGGGLYAVGDGIAAAYVDDDRAVVRELLGVSEEAALSAAAGIGAMLGCGTAELWQVSDGGVSYIAADGEICPRCVWNLSFD